jgi:hypothetical protein
MTEQSEYYSTCRNLVPLDSAGAGLFSALKKSNNFKGDEDEAAVMVHAGLLNLFLSLRTTQAFQDQVRRSFIFLYFFEFNYCSAYEEKFKTRTTVDI